MRERTLMVAGGGVTNPITPSESTAGDVCFYDKINDKLVIAKKDEWSYSSNFIPIGIVVVPGSHNVYGVNGMCGVMSLKYMSCVTPNEGSTDTTTMCWGGYNVDISGKTELTDYEDVPYVGSNGSVWGSIQGVSGHAFLPSDAFNKVANPYDPETKYYNNEYSIYAPSPYVIKYEGSNEIVRNTLYYQTSGNSSALNCLSDFNGVGNTKVLTTLADSGQTSWKTASTISNLSSANHYPAACCCWRYSTIGTAQGQWYLPAMGELGYMIARFNAINATISKLIEAYGSTNISLVDKYGFWSSTEYDSTMARRPRPSNGVVDHDYKNNANHVRAFLRI